MYTIQEIQSKYPHLNINGSGSGPRITIRPYGHATFIVDVDGNKFSVTSDHGIDHIFSNFNFYSTWKDEVLKLISPLMIDGMKVSCKRTTGYPSDQIVITFDIGMTIIINVDTTKPGHLFFSNGILLSDSFQMNDLVKNIGSVLEKEMDKFTKMANSLGKIISGLSATTIDQRVISDKLITIDVDSESETKGKNEIY